MPDTILESFSPPKKMWRAFNGVEPVWLQARVLRDGATVPVGDFFDSDGRFSMSLDGAFDTEREAIESLITDYEEGMEDMGKRIDELTRDLDKARSDHAALVKRLESLTP